MPPIMDARCRWKIINRIHQRGLGRATVRMMMIEIGQWAMDLSFFSSSALFRPLLVFYVGSRVQIHDYIVKKK